MTTTLPVYLDYNATTPIDRRVLDAMMPYLTDQFANPSSTHMMGRQAAAAVEQARKQVAEAIGATPRDIVFTSGATESNNLALKGIAGMYGSQGNHIITSQAEHRAVVKPVESLREQGFEVAMLKPDRFGRVSAQQVEDAITERTILVSIMAANNETGTLSEIEEIGKVTRRHKVFFHTDATQAIGRVPLDVDRMCVDLLSLSGHKVYAPKGVGALYVRRAGPRVRLTPQLDGGGHEHGLRSGTLNVAGIVGLGEACEIAVDEMAEGMPRLRRLRDRLEQGLLALGYVTVNGHPQERLANTSNLSFEHVEGESLMMRLPNLAVSTGSACGQQDEYASHVLLAMDVPMTLARSTIRFSLGRMTTQEDVDYAIGQVSRAVDELRKLSPTYESAARHAGHSGGK